MVTGSRKDPYSAFNFLVEIGGVTVAGFSECTGLNTETDGTEYRAGDLDIKVRKLPGLKKFGNITLKRGFTNSRELWEWRRRVLAGRTERKSGSVVLLNEAREPALRWSFRAAWPRKWEGPAFNAKSNEVAIETLELVCEGIKLE